MKTHNGTIFDQPIKELKSRGITLTLAPGEYIVNFAKGSTATKFRTDDFAAAVAHGLAMGPAPVALPPLGPMGSTGAARRGRIYAHNRKLAARRRKQQEKR